MQTQIKKQVEQASTLKGVQHLIDKLAAEKDMRVSERNALYNEAVAHYQASRQFFAPMKRTSDKNGKTYLSLYRGTIKSDGSREVKANRWNEVINCEVNEAQQIYDALGKYLAGKLPEVPRSE